MSVTLTGTGGLFKRLGLIGGILNSVNTYRGTTLAGKIDTFSNEFNSNKAYIDTLYSSLLGCQEGMSGLLSFLRGEAESILVEMVSADNPQASKSLSDCLLELLRQMRASGDTVNASTVGSSTSADALNRGTGNLVVSLRNVIEASPWGTQPQYRENVLAEDILVTCTSDSYQGTATAGQESYAVAAEFSQGNSLRWDWPRGSGGSGNLTAIDASLDATAGNNLLTNSDFETFTVANTPDNWAITIGTVGTTVLSDTSVYTGSKCLRIKGDGSQLTELRQSFNDSTGTTQTLGSRRMYAVNVWLKKSGSLTGTLRIALVDSSGTVITDENGNNNSLVIPHTDLTTSYAPFSFIIVMPRVLSTTLRLQLKVATALASGESIYVDSLAVAEMTEVYPQGPLLAFFRGNTTAAVRDQYKATITNTAGGFQRLFDRLFDMKGQGLLLPSSGSPSISDSLIT